MSSASLSRPLFALFALAIVLISPALFAGFMGDDFIHVALFKPDLPVSLPDDASVYGLFSFMNADPQRNRELINLGILPWWTFPDMKYAFWRPLSELTHGLDNALWSGNAFLMHAHSIVWYLFLCILVLRLYRHFYPTLPPGLVVAGFALYLLDASHGFTVSWIANRNGLIAATFGIASVYAYVKGHDEGSYALKGWSLLLLTLALLSAELGVSTIGYLGAYALFIDKRPLIRSCLSVLPHILLVVTWWVVYKHLGFGAANADAYYLDPLASPLDFLSTLTQRLIVLFGSQWGLVPAEIYGFAGSNAELANGVLIIAILVVLMTVLALLPTLRNDNAARFWLCGAVFSSFPVCAAQPHDRLLLFIGVGAMGVFLSVLKANLDTSRGNKLVTVIKAPQNPLRKAFLIIFFVLHLVISPLILPLMAYSPKVWSAQIDMTPAELHQFDDIEEKQFVLFNVPISSSMALTIWRFNAGLEIPDAVWPVTNLETPLSLERLDDHSLILRKEGGFVQKEEESVRAIETQPFREGDAVELIDLTLSVVETHENRPTVVKLTFTKRLDDNNLVFLEWDEASSRYQRLTLPAPGNTIDI